MKSANKDWILYSDNNQRENSMKCSKRFDNYYSNASWVINYKAYSYELMKCI